MEELELPETSQAGQAPTVSTLGPDDQYVTDGPAPQSGETYGTEDSIEAMEATHYTPLPVSPPSADIAASDIPLSEQFDVPLPRFGMVAPVPDPRGESPLAALDALLARPFPRQLTVGVAIGAFVAVLLGFIIQVAIASGDWAHGGLAAGVDALLLAVAAGIGWGRRYQLGRREQKTVLLAAVLVGALLLTGVGNLLLVPRLHYIQGRTLEGSGQYAAAVAQYKAYGEKAPNAPDIARADVAWGEQMLAQKRYAEAARPLVEAVQVYTSDDALGRQANKDLYLTYSAWLSEGGVGLPYGDAAAHFATYRASKDCDSDCQTAAAALEAQARFLFGKQLASLPDLKDAVTQFDLVQSQFPASAYAAQAHTEGAAAYLAYGQALLAVPATCRGEGSGTVDASSPYGQLLGAFQTLAAKYGDTPQGKQATDALNAPVAVTGKVAGVPNNVATFIRLSTGINPDKQQFPFNFSTRIDPSSGAYSFGGVAQGDYKVFTVRDLGVSVEYHILRDHAGNLYNVHAGPLCAVQLSFNY